MHALPIWTGRPDIGHTVDAGAGSQKGARMESVSARTANSTTMAWLPGTGGSQLCDSANGAVRLGSPLLLDPPSGYELQKEIGRGGMGVVYKARHLRLKRPVALKMLLHEDHTDPAKLARFRLEAEAVAQLRHPNIVQVYDVGESGGRPFLARRATGGGQSCRSVDVDACFRRARRPS